MGKDKKKESPIPKVKDKTITHEKKKLKTASKLSLESQPKESIKCVKKSSKDFKEPQKSKAAKSSKSAPSTSTTSDEDAMEWEASEIQVLNTIQEIRKEFSARERSTVKQIYTPKSCQTSTSISLCIVIDTNIFLSYLDIVKSLVENSHYKSKVQICVPWMVLQELDLMKTKNEIKGKIEIMARKAASFILEQSTENASFRLQTLDEFRDCISLTDEENADDKILQWCIKLKKDVKKDVCLLSNDTIFCTKSTACGIPALQSQKIMDTLPSLLKKAQPNSDADCIAEDAPEPGPANRRTRAEPVKSSPVVSTRPDNFFEVFEGTVTPVFSQIIELEMKKAYDDIWHHIVKIKPPWKLLDTLQCFEKHWIAVFSFIYSKDFKHKLEQLASIWKKQRYERQCRAEETENLIETTICVMQFIKKVSKEAGKSVERCISTLKTFQEKQPMLDDTFVLNFFTRIWHHINFVCGTVADVVGIPHTIVYTRGSCIPTAQEIEEGLRMLSPLLALIENAMMRYIEASDSPTMLLLSSRELSNCLTQANAQLGLKIDCPSDDLQDSLVRFISNAQSKELVTNGLNQLRSYMEVLHVVSLKLQS